MIVLYLLRWGSLFENYPKKMKKNRGRGERKKERKEEREEKG